MVSRHPPSPEASPFASTVAQWARVDKTGDKMVDRKAMGDKTGGKQAPGLGLGTMPSYNAHGVTSLVLSITQPINHACGVTSLR